ncbi:MAG: hypothetical protein ACR2OT_04825 [Parvibaculales bacterium]
MGKESRPSARGGKRTKPPKAASAYTAPADGDNSKAAAHYASEASIIDARLSFGQ